MPSMQVVQLLRSKVIPWTSHGSVPSVVVAKSEMNAKDLPDGVTLSQRSIKGGRVVMKGGRFHGNQRVYVATYPEDNLQELAIARLACIISGSADYLLGDSCVHCGPGTFIVMPPHVPHQCNAPHVADKRQWNSSCFSLHALAHSHGIHFWYSGSINEKEVNEAADNYHIPSLRSMQIMSLLVDELVETRPHSESVASGLLASFFEIIAREIELGNYTHPGPKGNVYQASLPTSSFAEQIRGYLEDNCHRMLKVEGVAARFYMSKSQFSRRIRQETGLTFIDLLTRIRIERAQQMLQETDLTATVIAAYVSYRSYTHFHAVFCANVGCTPIEYRNQSRKRAD